MSLKYARIFLLIITLLAQTDANIQLSNLLTTIMYVLMTIFIPVLLIYAFFSSIINLLKTGVRAVVLHVKNNSLFGEFLHIKKIASVLALIAQTQSQNSYDIVGMFTSLFISLFTVILPAIFILLLWKAFIKLVRS